MRTLLENEIVHLKQSTTFLKTWRKITDSVVSATQIV
jgi:hypothetical protein